MKLMPFSSLVPKIKVLRHSQHLVKKPNRKSSHWYPFIKPKQYPFLTHPNLCFETQKYHTSSKEMIQITQKIENTNKDSKESMDFGDKKQNSDDLNLNAAELSNDKPSHIERTISIIEDEPVITTMEKVGTICPNYFTQNNVTELVVNRNELNADELNIFDMLQQIHKLNDQTKQLNGKLREISRKAQSDENWISNDASKMLQTVQSEINETLHQIKAVRYFMSKLHDDSESGDSENVKTVDAFELDIVKVE